MEIITGYVGKAHVKAEQDRDINQGIIGPGSYVLKTGMQLAAEVSSNNEIKIRDGVLMHQGCAASIKKNTYDSLTIINGSQGMKRIDLIIARYKKDQNNGTESLELKVIQGTPAEANAEVPSYTEGDIQAGDYVADMPLYKVIIDGLNITEVKKVFEIVGSNKDLADRLDKDYILAYGTWYANGTVIPLNDSYLNYRDIIIRTGWNNQNGGIRDHRLSIQKNGTTIYEIVPIYQATKYIGVLVVEFNPNTPNQIKIVQSTGITSASATTGIRNIMGRTKLS